MYSCELSKEIIRYHRYQDTFVPGKRSKREYRTKAAADMTYGWLRLIIVFSHKEELHKDEISKSTMTSKLRLLTEKKV